MNYAKAQKDVLTRLTKVPDAVAHCIFPDRRVGFIVDDVLGFVFPEDTNWIDCDKILASVGLASLHLPSGSASEVLLPTENLIDRESHRPRRRNRPRVPQAGSHRRMQARVRSGEVAQKLR